MRSTRICVACVLEALCAASQRLNDLLVTEPDENPSMSKLDKKALTRLNKLVDDLVYFAMTEVYPSPEFILFFAVATG